MLVVIMLVKEGKKTSILTEGINENGIVYRGILELMGRFGYVSMEEVKYGFGLSEQEARDRLKYLVRQGFIKTFRSLVYPQVFFCLKRDGVAAVRSYAISDDVFQFDSERYRPFNQNHDRGLVRIFCALRKMLGADLEAWINEKNLRREESLKSIMAAYNEIRILDGLFQIKVHKSKFSQNSNGVYEFQGASSESWWCGLELELSVKSASRYRKQFEVLSECVYDRVQEKQNIPLVFFLCGTPAIYKSLVNHQQERTESYGRCIFVFGQVDQFLRDPEKSPLVRFVGNESREITGRDLNHVNMKVTL